MLLCSFMDSDSDDEGRRVSVTPSPTRMLRLKAEAEQARLAHEANAEAELAAVAAAGGAACDDATQPGTRAASDAPVLTPDERTALLQRAKAALADIEKALGVPRLEVAVADGSPAKQRPLASLAPPTPAALMALCASPPDSLEKLHSVLAGGVLYMDSPDCACAALNACGPYFATGTLRGRQMAPHVTEATDGLVIRLIHGALGTHLDLARVCRMACAVACALAARPDVSPRPAPDAALAQAGWAVATAMRAHPRLRAMQAAGVGALVALHLHRAAAATPFGEDASENVTLDVAAWQAAGALAPLLRAVRGAAVGASARARASTSPTAADCASVVGGSLIGAAALRWAASAPSDAKKEGAALQNAVEALAAAPGFLSAVNSVVVMSATKELVAPDAPNVLPADTSAALKAAVAAVMTAALTAAQQM